MQKRRWISAAFFLRPLRRADAFGAEPAAGIAAQAHEMGAHQPAFDLGGQTIAHIAVGDRRQAGGIGLGPDLAVGERDAQLAAHPLHRLDGQAGQSFQRPFRVIGGDAAILEGLAVRRSDPFGVRPAQESAQAPHAGQVQTKALPLHLPQRLALDHHHPAGLGRLRQRVELFVLTGEPGRVIADRAAGEQAVEGVGIGANILRQGRKTCAQQDKSGGQRSQMHVSCPIFT